MTSLTGKTVVITGAASGIGEALAHALAAQNARLLLADAHWLMEINFWGVVHGCRAFTPQLQTRTGGVIVNLSSVFAMVSLPTQSIYNASKAAVRAFSDALREELREKPDQPSDTNNAQNTYEVRVLCVHPGGIRTRLVAQARLGDISAIAGNPEALHAQFQALARTSADQAAAAIVQALRDGRTRLLIGADARLGDWLFRMAPGRASAWFSSLALWGQQQLKRRDAMHAEDESRYIFYSCLRPYLKGFSPFFSRKWPAMHANPQNINSQVNVQRFKIAQNTDSEASNQALAL